MIKSDILKNSGIKTNINESKSTQNATNLLVTKYRKQIEELYERMKEDEKKIVAKIRDDKDNEWNKINQFRKVMSSVESLLPMLVKILSTE